MAISFGSINTGLPKDIVKQIMAAERIPIQNMESRKADINSKQELLGQLIQLVEGLRGDLINNRTARSLRELKVDTNNDLVDVQVDKNIAEPGTYQFGIEQLAQKSSAMSSGFADPEDSYVGVGFIQYTLPNGETKDIYVDSDNASLKSIAKIINKDQENGMRANVVNDGSDSSTPWRLIIALENTGDNFKADFPYLYFVDGEQDFYLERERQATDAKVKLDGFEIELQENKSGDLIPGVAVDLRKAKPGEEFTIKITEDVTAITGKIDNIIAKINEVLTFINQQNDLNENSNTRKTLGGDLTLQTLESRLRSAVFTPVETEFGKKRVSEVGISFQRNGLLQLDSARLENALANNFKAVAQILTGRFQLEGGKTNGFFDNLDGIVTGSLRSPDGVLKSRQRGLETQISQIDRRISDRERILDRKEKNLKDKFARLEGTISRIKNQGNGLSALVQGQPQNPVQQLGS